MVGGGVQGVGGGVGVGVGRGSEPTGMWAPGEGPGSVSHEVTDSDDTTLVGSAAPTLSHRTHRRHAHRHSPLLLSSPLCVRCVEAEQPAAESSGGGGRCDQRGVKGLTRHPTVRRCRAWRGISYCSHLHPTLYEELHRCGASSMYTSHVRFPLGWPTTVVTYCPLCQSGRGTRRKPEIQCISAFHISDQSWPGTEHDGEPWPGWRIPTDDGYPAFQSI